MNKEKILKILPVAIPILLPFFATFIVIVTYGVNVVFMDEWALVRLFEADQNGTLSIGEFWEQHNEHRIFFVSMVTLGLGKLTHWHLGYQMMVSLFLALGMLGVFCVYAKKEFKANRLRYGIYLFVISALIFSLVQWENWLRGFQMQWFMCIVPGVLALYLLDARAKIWNYNIRFWLAVFLCFVSAYSLGSGIFFWLAGLVPLFATKQSWRRILLWAGAALISFALYFYDYLFLESFGTGAQPVHYAQFFFGYIGNALTSYPEVAVIFGMILISLTAIALFYSLRVKRVSLSTIALPVGMIIFVIMSALVTTKSRTNVTGAFGAVTSKYATISTLLIVALILILMQVHRTKSALVPVVVSAVLLPLVAGVSLHGLAEAKVLQRTLTEVKTCLMQEPPTEQCLGRTHPSPGVAKEKLIFLKKHHLGGF